VIGSINPIIADFMHEIKGYVMYIDFSTEMCYIQTRIFLTIWRTTMTSLLGIFSFVVIGISSSVALNVSSMGKIETNPTLFWGSVICSVIFLTLLFFAVWLESIKERAKMQAFEEFEEGSCSSFKEESTNDFIERNKKELGL